MVTPPSKPRLTDAASQKKLAYLSLDVLAVLDVALARELAEPSPAVGARDQARVRRRRFRRRQVGQTLAALLSVRHNPCLSTRYRGTHKTGGFNDECGVKEILGTRAVVVEKQTNPQYACRGLRIKWSGKDR